MGALITAEILEIRRRRRIYDVDTTGVLKKHQGQTCATSIYDAETS